MELRTLRYFLAVAREQNMTEAANILHVTQPTLSRQIADLERELGTTLFVRTNRATTLTADGMRLRQRADEILSLVDQTEEELSPHGTELAGNIRIGAGETQAVRTVTDVFAELHRDYPRVTCELFSGNADTVEERLERGLLDFAVFIEPAPLEKYDWVRLPTTDRMGVAVSATSPWAGLGHVTPSDLAKMPLLMSSRTSNRVLDLHAWSGGVLETENLNLVGTFDLIGNAAHLVRNGTACALGIDHLLQISAGDIVFLPLEPEVTVNSVVAWKRYRLFSRACEEFLTRLKAACGEA